MINFGLDDLCDWLEESGFYSLEPGRNGILAAYRRIKWLVELAPFTHGIGAILTNIEAESNLSSILYSDLENLLADVKKFDADPSEWGRQFK